MPFNADLDAQLRDFLITRDIRNGISLATTPAVRELLDLLSPEVECSYSLLALHLLFIDAGAPRPPKLSDLLSNFMSSAGDPAAVLSDYALLRLSLGIHHMVVSRFAHAITVFENLQWIPMKDPFYRVIRHYCLARCLARSARYQEADRYYEVAINQCAHSNFDTLRWVISANRAWPILQLNDLPGARALLQQAEGHIPDYDDVTWANIHSTYARIHRRELNFSSALERYAEADRRLRDNGFSDHPSRARILIQMAVTQRYLALQDDDRKLLLRTIRHSDKDKESMQLGRLIRMAKAKRDDPRLGKYKKWPFEQYLSSLKEIISEFTTPADQEIAELAKHVQDLRGSARDNLEEALSIYESYNHSRAGNAVVHLAYLDLDQGDLEAARQKAIRAEEYAMRSNDRYLAVTVAVLTNIVFYELMEQEIMGDLVPSPKEYFVQAQVAYDMACKLQNPRLTLRAQIALGLALYRTKCNAEARTQFLQVLEKKAELQIKGEDPILWNLNKLKQAIDKIDTEKPSAIVSNFILQITAAIKKNCGNAISAWSDAREEFDAYLLDQLCQLVPRNVSNSRLARLLGSNRAQILGELKKRRPMIEP